ncbi:hypothetical protein [Halobacillus dabanensis]|uniref:hypothetical protein n=1 Tax=Halobacillus dabanensis TaxID=240302 RepID=UPI001ABF53B6|nr:hypothetical protein [Halobacillus dabanensis]
MATLRLVACGPSLFVSEGLFIFVKEGLVKKLIKTQRIEVEIQTGEGDSNVDIDDGVGGNHDFFLPVRHISLL